MADSKITALTALTAADPTVDMFPVVDVSDTTMAASGTTKRISINNILACSPSATLASATITGALTIGGATSFPASVINTSGGNPVFTPTAATLFLYSGSSFLSIRNQANTQEIFNLTPAGVYTFGDGAGGTRMTLNATGLGVGGVPSGTNRFLIFNGATQALTLTTSGDLLLGAGISGARLSVRDAAGNDSYIGLGANNDIYLSTGTSGVHYFRKGAASAAMTLDAVGNLLIGLTAAGTTAAKTIQIANGTAPTANVTGGQLYVEAGALKYRGSSGTVTTIANA